MYMLLSAPSAGEFGIEYTFKLSLAPQSSQTELLRAIKAFSMLIEIVLIFELQK